MRESLEKQDDQQTDHDEAAGMGQKALDQIEERLADPWIGLFVGEGPSPSCDPVPKPSELHLDRHQITACLARPSVPIHRIGGDLVPIGLDRKDRHLAGQNGL